MIALAVAAIVASTGRTAATRAMMLAELESPAARLVRVTDRTGEGRIPMTATSRLTDVSAVEWFVALDAAGAIARNAGGGDPTRGYTGGAAGLRGYSGDLLGGALGGLVGGRPPAAGEAVAGVDAARALGFADGRGFVVDDSRRVVTVTGVARFRSEVANLNAYVLVNSDVSRDVEPVEVGELLVLSRGSQSVQPLVELLPTLLGPRDPRALAVEQAAELVRLRERLGREVGDLNAAILLGSLLFAAALVGANVFGVVATRRHQIGLQRTQGAQRSSIAALLLVETAAIAGLGAVAGAVVGTLITAVQSALIPDPLLTISAATLVMLTAIAGALPPASSAAMQEPLYALRS